MARSCKRISIVQALAGALLATTAAAADDAVVLPNMVPFPNPTGMAATFSTQGAIDLTNPFFASLGTNGRSCGSCHVASAAWTITPPEVKARFDATAGTDPIFRTNDGSNSPHADVSSVDARRAAFSMLLDKAVIRIGLPIPANAEFELTAVDDPYGYASASELSLFRRPLPSTNLKFLSAVMWDGRETFTDATSHDCILGTSTCFAPLHVNLADQANTATVGHAQAAAAIDPAQRAAIVAFETTLFTAQIYDDDAGNLMALRAQGGPRTLAESAFYFGINDVLAGDYRTHAAFDPSAFDLYDTWDSAARIGPMPIEKRDRVTARLAVARGQALFNGKAINITNVKGLNDDLHTPVIRGTCTTCHDTPNAGNHSVPVPLDIGIADASRRTPDLPLYTLRNRATGEIVQTTDPGRALITGKWKDIGRFKGPVLRALAARAPYFHNGMAADLDAVVEFYNTRFEIGFTDAEKRDLAAFLRTL
jgi:hypothetical protein